MVSRSIVDTFINMNDGRLEVHYRTPRLEFGVVGALSEDCKVGDEVMSHQHFF
jgi:hypothetical protein